MPPTIALFIWLVLLLALLRFDPAKDPEISAAIWVPVIWIFFLATRLPSQWWGAASGWRLKSFRMEILWTGPLTFC